MMKQTGSIAVTRSVKVELECHCGAQFTVIGGPYASAIADAKRAGWTIELRSPGDHVITCRACGEHPATEKAHVPGVGAGLPYMWKADVGVVG